MTASFTFRLLAILGLLGMAALIPLQLRARRRAYSGIHGYAPRVTLLERLAYLALLLSVLVLSLTGLTFAIIGKVLGGWFLILHVGAAPLFALAVAALAVLWADRRQYAASPGAQELDTGTKLLFWLMVLAAEISMLSAVLPMTPLFGSHPMHLLLDIHRYSSLALFILVVLHFFRFAAAR
jgi:cytochrome b subunit of formate dehydrogenase